MSFFKKLFGEKKKEIVKKELKLGEVREYAHTKIEKKEAELKKELASQIAEVKHLIRELQNDIEGLGNKSVEVDEGNTRLRKVVVTSKENVERQMKNLLEKLSVPSTESVREMFDYCKNAKLAVEKELPSFRKSLAYTGILIKEELKKIGKHLQELHSILQKAVDGVKDSNVLGFSALEECVEKLGNEISEKESCGKKIVEIKENLGKLEQELIAVEKDVGKIQTGDDAKNLRKLQQEIEDLDKDAADVVSGISDLIAPAEKILKRMVQLSQSGKFPLNKEEEDAINKYMYEPATVMSADPKGEIIKRVASQAIKLVEDSTISVKEKEVEKRINAMRKLQEYDFFGNVFWKLNETQAKKDSLRKEISGFKVGKLISDKKEEVNEIENKIEQAKKIIEIEESKLGKINQAIEELKEKVEKTASKITNEEITIL